MRILFIYSTYSQISSGHALRHLLPGASTLVVTATDEARGASEEASEVNEASEANALAVDATVLLLAAVAVLRLHAVTVATFHRVRTTAVAVISIGAIVIAPEARMIER